MIWRPMPWRRAGDANGSDAETENAAGREKKPSSDGVVD
jgi:hypothetical protein